MRQTLERLRREILARHVTIHAFCRATPEIARSTVYQLLAGKYPGNEARQIQRVRTALSGVPECKEERPVLTAAEAYDVLLAEKCGHCRKLDKSGCRECRTRTLGEAQAIEKYVLSRQRETP